MQSPRPFLQIGHRITLIACLLLFIGMSLIWLISHFNSRVTLQEQADSLGETLARQTALLVTELVLSNDMISMNVLLNELTRNAPISQVAVFNVDDQVLAISGSSVSIANLNPSGGDRVLGSYIAPIALQDSLAGYVRVHLDQQYILSGQSRHFWMMLAALVLMLSLNAALLLPLTRRLMTETESSPELASAVLWISVSNSDEVLEQDGGEDRMARFQQLLQDVTELYGADADINHNDHARLTFSVDGDTGELAFQALCCATLLLALNNRQNKAGDSACRLQLQAGLHCAEPQGDTTLISGHGETGRIAELICASSPIDGLLVSENLLTEAGINSHFHYEQYDDLFDAHDGDYQSVYLVRSPLGSTRTLLQRQAALLNQSSS